MATNGSLNFFKKEDSQNQEMQANSDCCASTVHDVLSPIKLQVLCTKVGQCDEIVFVICKHLPKLLSVRLVNKKWCHIASNILRERSNVWISLSKQFNVRGRNNGEPEWSNVNPASRNNTKLIDLDRLLNANSNFPCQNYWISVGIQGSSGTPSTFIVKWIDRIKSLHFDVQQMPFLLVFGNYMAKTGFVAVQNVQNLQVEHGPYDWGLPRNVVRGTAPRLDRLKKLTLPGNLICDRTSWRDVLREAVNLERIENCTFPFLPEIITQNKIGLVKSIYLNFHLKPNPALGLTLQENVNVFTQAVQQGLQLEDILAFDIEIFIAPHKKAEPKELQQPEKMPSRATLTKWYQTVVEAFNLLLQNSQETLQSAINISCLGYASKAVTSGGCHTHINIPRMTKMREIDWLTLHENPLMKMDLLFPLENGDFLASRCFPNIKDILADPSKKCWDSLSLKSSSVIEELTRKLSMPSATRLFWFCSHLDSNYFINRDRDCNLIQHLIHPMFPNLTEMHLQSLVFSQIPIVLTKVFEFYSNTLQELNLTNRCHELPKQSKGEMWCLDASITGLNHNLLSILRENVKNVHAKTVQLLQTRPSIRSMNCLRKLSFSVHDPDHFDGGNIPLISEVSQLYGFEWLPQLTVVIVDSGENYRYDSDDEYEQQQQQQQQSQGYYQSYRYHKQQPKQRNGNRHIASLLENQQLEEQQTKVELLFLKDKIQEKIQDLKHNSEMFRELKSVLVDVERLLLNNV